MSVRRKRRDRPVEDAAGPQVLDLATKGGRLEILDDTELARIHDVSVTLLAEFGMSDAPLVVAELVCAAGGRMTEEQRLTFPPDLVARALAGLRRDVALCGRLPEHDMALGNGAVHVGSGGAAPMILNIDSDTYRETTLGDLYDAARLGCLAACTVLRAFGGGA